MLKYQNLSFPYSDESVLNFHQLLSKCAPHLTIYFMLTLLRKVVSFKCKKNITPSFNFLRIQTAEDFHSSVSLTYFFFTDKSFFLSKRAFQSEKFSNFLNNLQEKQTSTSIKVKGKERKDETPFHEQWLFQHPETMVQENPLLPQVLQNSNC